MNQSRSHLIFHLFGIFILSLCLFLIGKNGLDKIVHGEQQASPEGTTSTRSTRDRKGGDPRWQTDSGRMDLLRGRLARYTAPEDFRSELSDMLMLSDKSEVNRHLALLFEAWLQVDPRNAVRATAEVEKVRHDFHRVSDVFFKWASTNPDAAAGLLEYSLDGKQSAAGADPPFLDGVDSPALMLAAVSGLATQDPKRAGDILANMKASPIQASAFSILIQSWASEESDAALEWTKAIESDETRRLAMGFMAEELVQHEKNYADALAKLDKLENAVDREVALQTFMGEWTDRQADKAFEYVESLPDGEMKLLLMPEVVEQQIVTGEAEVTAWLNTQEPSKAMDPTIIAYSIALANLQPGNAMERVATVTDPGQREATYYILADRWSRRDPAGLQSYLAGLQEVPPILTSFLQRSSP